MKRIGLLLLVLLAGCQRHDAGSSTTKIKVVATTGMVGDLVRNVGGSHVEVTDLFKPGVDPHSYRTTTDDLRKLQATDIVFYNGLHLEGKMGEVFARLSSQKPCIAVADSLEKGLPPPAKESTGCRDNAIYAGDWLLHEDKMPDPHVWFDVHLWAKTVGEVQKALKKLDPSRAADYDKNAAEYVARLETLDCEIRKELAAIPKERRVLVTSHDAFRYLGRAYDIDVRGVQGINTETEASVEHIAELVDFLTKSKVKAVFVETSVNDRKMRSLIEGCQARGHAVVQGGELFSDAMGDPKTPEGTYEGMIRHNVKTIVNALK